MWFSLTAECEPVLAIQLGRNLSANSSLLVLVVSFMGLNGTEPISMEC